MNIRALILFSLVLIIYGCSNGSTTLPSVSGNKYEILVVMDLPQWKAPAGRSLVALLDSDIEGLPQPEPNMKINRCNRIDFNDMLKPARNILLTQISNKVSKPKVIYTTNKWAQPQSIVYIQTPNDSAFVSTIKTYGANILDFFLRTERERQIEFNKTMINANAKKEIEKKFGIQIDITTGINKSIKKKDFYWITNDNANVRQDIVIYSYPYTDRKMFTKEYILAKRDSIMKENLPGEFDGSYMGTEYKYYPPTFKVVSVNKEYCAEVRGLWKMKNGSAMGGPFVSHTRLDEINHRVITIEGFVFAPGAKKGNPMRQLEAIIYSAKLPQEINILKEITVKGKK